MITLNRLLCSTLCRSFLLLFLSSFSFLLFAWLISCECCPELCKYFLIVDPLRELNIKNVASRAILFGENLDETFVAFTALFGYNLNTYLVR